LSIALALALIITNMLGYTMPRVAKAEATYLINEGFNGGTTAPAGWTFANIGGTYTSAGNFGAASPSLKLDSSTDKVTTPVFSNPTNLSFWIKGQTTNEVSSLLVEQYDGTAWSTLGNINPLPATGTTMTYALQSNIVQIRFSYNKGTGNLALDDVKVETGAALEKVAAVTANVAPDAVDDGTTVTLSTATEGASILYTFDESAEPDTAYTEPITINRPMKIKAKASKTGMVDSDAAIFSYTLNGLSTIADAKILAKGSDTMVIGRVTTAPGSYGKKSFYMQDDTAGVLVYTDTVVTDAVIGDTVKIKGKTDAYNGKFEIVPTSIEVVDMTTVEPSVISVDIAGAGEANEARLVCLTNLQITQLTSDSYKNATITLSDGTQTIKAKLDSRTGYNSDQLTVKLNDYVDVTGVLEQDSTTTYRVMLRDLNDISLTGTVTIGAARELAKGSSVVVIGRVLNLPASFGSSKSFYIQDNTSGALVYIGTVLPVEIGDTVKVTGTTDDFGGKFEVKPASSASVEVIDNTTEVYPPITITIPEIGETYEGRLVSVKNAKVISVTKSDSYGSAEIVINDGTNNGTVKLDNRTGFTYDNVTVKADDMIDVQGVVEQSGAAAYML
jgi:uncharacterized protein YdeI (BOF family)